MERQFDIIVFGASGFTGELIVEELAKNASQENIRWAVAGRNHQKVQQVLMQVQKRLDTDQDLKGIQIFYSDIGDKESLELTCQNTKLLINCVGPYRKYGETVLETCLKCRTHCLDMTVEISYFNHIMLKYNKEAESQGVYIISACGVAYLFFEMGIQLLQKKYEGRIQKIDLFVKPKFKLRSVHFATWDSIVNVNKDGLRNLVASKQKIYSEIMNKKKSKLSILGLALPVKPSREAKGLGINLPSIIFPDSIRLDTKEETSVGKSVKFNYYCTTDSMGSLLISLTIGFFFLCLNPSRPGRWLMTKYPGFFSCGLVKKSALAEKTKDTATLNFTAVATGWSRRQRQILNVAKIPNRTAVLYGCGPPGYKASAICIVQAAFTVLLESDHLPERGGIYSPLAAFGNTSLPSRLQKNGITYKLKNEEFTV